MPKKDFSEVKKEVKKIIAEMAHIPAKDLKEEAKFVEELGIDSMMALEIVASIEKKYKVIIPEDDIPKVTCLKNVYDLLEKLL